MAQHATLSILAARFYRKGNHLAKSSLLLRLSIEELLHSITRNNKRTHSIALLIAQTRHCAKPVYDLFMIPEHKELIPLLDPRDGVFHFTAMQLQTLELLANSLLFIVEDLFSPADH